MNTNCHDTSKAKNGVFDELFENYKRSPIPPKGPTTALVTGTGFSAISKFNFNIFLDFFVNFNNLFPLFHRPTFEYLLDKQFSDNPPADSGWYAALNMVLAIACRLRISHPGPIDDEVSPWIGVDRSWQYFQNAAGLLTELLLKNSDLIDRKSVV